MRMHDGRKPAPAGPLFGLSPEEAWRRFAFSGRQPCEVYAHPGPWFVAILLWPHACPTYGALWSWCGYCGGPTQDVSYVEDGGAQWLCHPCAEWAQILRPGVVKGAFVLMPSRGVVPMATLPAVMSPFFREALERVLAKDQWFLSALKRILT